MDMATAVTQIAVCGLLEVAALRRLALVAVDVIADAVEDNLATTQIHLALLLDKRQQ
jgi:hypothetical protein